VAKWAASHSSIPKSCRFNRASRDSRELTVVYAHI
jgi:hypothetical protein